MSSVKLDESFLAKIAGWDVIKQARAMLAGERVISSAWEPPVLKGVVQDGSSSMRCGFVIKDAFDIENLCPCRASRSWGTMCAHSVAVGLHWLRAKNPPPPPESTKTPLPKSTELPPAKAYKRIQRGENGAGESIELYVIFPPNLAQALSKKVMLYIEAKLANGRMPLNAVPKSVAYNFGEEDLPLLDAIEKIGGDTPGMLMLNSAELATVLKALEGHPRATIGKSTTLEISREPLHLSLQATLEKSGEIQLAIQNNIPDSGLIYGTEQIWILQANVFRPVLLPRNARELLNRPVRLPREVIPQFLSQDWPALAQSCEIQSNFTLEDFELVQAQPRIHLELSGGVANLQAKLHFNYGGKTVTAGVKDENASAWMADPSSPLRYGTRDLQLEQNAVQRLLRAGFTGPHDQGTFQLAGQSTVLTFFARDYYRLEKEWKVTMEERLERSASQNLERIEPQFEITSSGEQWFDLDVAFKSGSGEKFSAAEIQRLILSGQSHSRLKNGKFAIIDTGAVEELQEVLLDCSPRQQENRYRIQSTQAGFLASALKENSTWQVTAPKSWREKAISQSGEAKMAPPPLGNLEKVLRPYQTEGVAWLEFLRSNRFGGILADEMGLGKTLQTLAFLQSVRDRTEPANCLPSLIVCPTSLVFNWVNEAVKFTPGLKVLALHGPKRQDQFEEVPTSDLVITSYALIRRDAELYRQFEFEAAVLDEAQHIKNRQTQNAQAVKMIQARHRFVLTGTPIENSVLDLWSIFDFLMPGYLGAAKDFKERYEVPITKEKNSEAQKRLSRRIRPFLLRRLKRDVAKDLPEKIEQVSFCELSSDQQEVYQQLLESSRQEISSAVSEQGLQRSRMIMLTALLRLRQACCDLRLLKLQNASESNSSKLELFNEFLQEVIDGGHRVLVFSQFVEMLQILKQSLEEEKIQYCYLDGSSTERGKIVEQFQSGNIPVFLISLKAGGVGLNLSAADTVIHFDPWWNPAVEAQATDRAHRIGQTRVVTSYKLITRGTVEEKILHLQNKKRELIDATLDGEEQFTNSLTWEELQDLFR
ncbi:MAG: SNF2-related protein [Verrucomicrobiota bacterium]